MGKALRSLIRISAFLRKEIVEIVRQPRLLFTLVLGPFLILLLFGVGYTANPIALRTLFVIPEDSVLRPYLRENATHLIQQLVFEGMIGDEELAKARLRANEVDLVIFVPPGVSEKVRDSQQATFVFYHDAIDPIRVRYMQSFANLFVNEMNRRVLRVFAEEGQAEASAVAPELRAARENAQAMRRALEREDFAQAEKELDSLQGHVTSLQAALIASTLLLGRLEGDAGMQGASDPAGFMEQILEALDTLERQQEREGNVQEGEAEQALTDIEEDLARLESSLDQFRRIDSGVLVSPFRGDLKNVLPIEIDLVDYYVPSVIAILLQHLCVTFGALSIVREGRTGTMELFQASPLSAFEVLAGKYLSYVLFIAFLTAVLSALLAFGLGAPMLGAWRDYALAIVALLFASLGIGFVISLLAQTTSQAVQYSMLVLLVSVFFTGFFLNLELLQVYVRLLSWAIPGTYGIQLLQEIMLRGQPINLTWAAVLAAIGLGLFAAAWFLLRRRMARS